MAFATDAQRRWFFAHLATGMRRIAGKMKAAHLPGKPPGFQDQGRGIPRGPGVFEVTHEGLEAEYKKSREYHPENIGKLTRAQSKEGTKIKTYPVRTKWGVRRVTVPPREDEPGWRSYRSKK